MFRCGDPGTVVWKSPRHRDFQKYNAVPVTYAASGCSAAAMMSLRRFSAGGPPSLPSAYKSAPNEPGAAALPPARASLPRRVRSYRRQAAASDFAAGPGSCLGKCRAAMSRNKMRHLPVVEDGKLVGIISSGDILSRELVDQEETIRYLHEYMHGPG